MYVFHHIHIIFPLLLMKSFTSYSRYSHHIHIIYPSFISFYIHLFLSTVVRLPNSASALPPSCDPCCAAATKHCPPGALFVAKLRIFSETRCWLNHPSRKCSIHLKHSQTSYVDLNNLTPPVNYCYKPNQSPHVYLANHLAAQLSSLHVAEVSAENGRGEVNQEKQRKLRKLRI